MDSQQAQPPTRANVDLAAIEPGKQFQFFVEETCRRLVQHDCIKISDRRDFPGHIQAVDAGSSHGTLLETPLFAVRRSRRNIEDDEKRYFFLNYVVRGVMELEQGDERRRAAAGNLLVVDSSRPLSIGTTSSNDAYSNVIVRLRPEDFSDNEAREALFCEKRLARHRLAPLLRMSLAQLAPSMKRTDDQETATLIGIVESITHLITHDKAVGAYWQKTDRIYRLIEQEIVRHLEDPDLGLFSIALELGLSVRHIQRVMASFDTCFSDFVRERRLRLAMSRLREARYAAKSIEEIAYGCGFTELSSFYRAFKKMFHCTPGDARRNLAMTKEDV